MKVYLVGGAVRDSLLNIPALDHDWVVVGATPEELLAIGYQKIGKDFPVFLHPNTREEYALARTERKSGHGYNGFTCYAGTNVTLEDDLLRRDLTINAIARSSEGTLIDPYRGIADLQARTLRHVSDAFSEDPLRVLRVAGFAARFAHLGFKIADETLELMRHISQSGELMTLRTERVWKETLKALQSQNPEVYFKVLRDCEALIALFPEIKSGTHTMTILTVASRLSQDAEVRFSALCHDLRGGPTSYKFLSHHDNPGITSHIKLIESLYRRFKIPNAMRELATLVARYHSVIYTVNTLQPRDLIKLFDAIDVWRRPWRLDQMILSSEAAVRARIGFRKNIYPQGEYLRQAYQVANSISVKEIITYGLRGTEIRHKLRRQQEQMLADWKLDQSIMKE